MANPITTPEGFASIGTFCSPGKASASSILVPAYATASPSSPPNPESNKLSVSSCRTILPRAAPSADRSDISTLRAMPRTSSRFAMFAHATSRTSPAIHISR